MSYQTLSVVSKDVKTNEIYINDKRTNRVGKISFKNDKFSFNPPLSLELNKPPQTFEASQQALPGLTGNFSEIGSTGVYPTSELNNVNYIPSEKKFYYSEVGGYLAQKDTGKINISNYSILPKIDAIPNTEPPNDGLELGSENAFWKAIYVNELVQSKDSTYIFDRKTGKKMKISYDPSTLQTFISNENTTVKTITTSQNIPNVIDPEYLPFTGMNFMGNFNPYTYSQVPEFEIDGVPNFVYQNIYLLNTLEYDQITQINSNTINPKTNTIFQKLSGAYYLVKDIPSNVEFVELQISNIEANTDLLSLNKSLAGKITSTYTIKDSKITELRNNDMIMLTLSLYKDTNGIIKILSQWNVVNFRVPINGITTTNIDDGAITNTKLSSGSVSFDKFDITVQDKINAIDLYTTRINDLTSLVEQLDTSNTELTNTVNLYNSKIQNLQNQNKLWEKRFLALEEFVNIFLKTNVIDYYENDEPTPGEVPIEYTYTGNLKNMVPDSFSITFFNVSSIDPLEKKIKIKLNEYTYTILNNCINLYYNGIFNRKIIKSEFNNVDFTLEIIIDDNLNNFPYSFEILNLNNEIISNFNLSYNQYLGLTN